MARPINEALDEGAVTCEHVKNHTSCYGFMPIGEEQTIALCRECWERIRAAMVLDTVERTMKQAWKPRWRPDENAYTKQTGRTWTGTGVARDD